MKKRKKIEIYSDPHQNEADPKQCKNVYIPVTALNITPRKIT